MVGVRSIKVAKEALLDTDHPFVLWLVPSDAICKQTLAVFRDRQSPIRQILEEELRYAEILDGEQALSFWLPATLTRRSGNYRGDNPKFSGLRILKSAKFMETTVNSRTILGISLKRLRISFLKAFLTAWPTSCGCIVH